MNLKTIDQFTDANPAFNRETIRQACSRKKDWRDAGVVIKFGKRVLIDEDKFFDWLKAQQL